MVSEESWAHTAVIESDALVAGGKGGDFTLQSCTNLVFGRLGECDVCWATNYWRSMAGGVSTSINIASAFSDWWYDAGPLGEI